MEFISLCEVLSGIAAKLPQRQQQEPVVSEKFKDDATVLFAQKYWLAEASNLDQARRLSDAARELNKSLHCSSTTPRWMRYDNAKGFAVPSDEVVVEGIDLLTHASGWYAREHKYCLNHVEDCFRNGWNPSEIACGKSTDDGIVPAKNFFGLYRVGFARESILSFLSLAGLDYDTDAPMDREAPFNENANSEMVVSGLTKQEIIAVFENIHFMSDSSISSTAKWSRALADPPKWLLGARINKGSRNRKFQARWNPVDLALGLIDQGVPLKKLDQAFFVRASMLGQWGKLWSESTDLMR